MEGGYLMIDLARSDLFNRLLIGIDLGKPILLRDGNQNFFIDRITGGSPIYDEEDILTGYSDIVLLSANGSITITDANVVTKDYVPNYGNHLYQYYIMINGEIGDNSVYIAFNLLSTTNINISDMDLDDVKTLIGKNCYIANIAYGDTSDYSLSNEVWSVNVDDDNILHFSSKDDDSYIENFTNLEVNTDACVRTKIF